MWVLTESGELVNLDQTFEVAFPWKARDQKAFTSVIAWAADPDRRGVRLCTCENEEYGRAIIEQLAHEINAGKRFVYISDVKKQAGVPRGDGEES